MKTLALVLTHYRMMALSPMSLVGDRCHYPWYLCRFISQSC